MSAVRCLNLKFCYTMVRVIYCSSTVLLLVFAGHLYDIYPFFLCESKIWQQFWRICAPQKRRHKNGVTYMDRVATAQGKQGIWLSLFPDRENTENLGTTQGIFQISLKMEVFYSKLPFHQLMYPNFFLASLCLASFYKLSSFSCFLPHMFVQFLV